ncbi:hypothetical protein HMPREF1012_01510 [Bacillus sp. BT1B_CT2]|nr:hypothetical protein HMPREF1012_01510 [Bacillus sp. BT1B_CT2]
MMREKGREKLTEQNAIDQIEQLRSGSIHELRVKKRGFSFFQSHLNKAGRF